MITSNGLRMFLCTQCVIKAQIPSKHTFYSCLKPFLKCLEDIKYPCKSNQKNTIVVSQSLPKSIQLSPSIHKLLLLQVGFVGQQHQQRSRSPSSQQPPPALPGEYQGVSKPAERCHFFSASCVHPGPPSNWTCPKYLPREASRRHLNQLPKPPQSSSLNMVGAATSPE